MKTISIAPLIALVAIGVAGSAYAQNAPMPSGPTNAPPGTSYQGQNPALPPSTTGTARPGALSANPSGAEAAARYKFEQAGFTNVKGLSRSIDGVWSGRAVKDGVEMAVSMDAGGNIAVQ
jgi:hypothetical protein